SSEPWFPTHPTREAYFDLINTEPLPPTKTLKTALLKRAMTNVYRIWSLREDRSTLSLLLRNGAIGDDLWQEFLAAEQELNEEIMECVNEAEELESGWGKTLFQQASEMCVMERQREAMKVCLFFRLPILDYVYGVTIINLH
ncbi:Sec62/63 complex, subunit Sec66, partial [Paraphysoderma sedebokerense]